MKKTFVVVLKGHTTQQIVDYIFVVAFKFELDFM